METREERWQRLGRQALTDVADTVARVRENADKRTMETEDRLLNIEEAAERLKTSKDWLYRHWRKLPFTVQLSPKQLRFSAKGIERYLEEKQRARTSV